MLEIILIAVGLCMDTLAVSIASGCLMKPYKASKILQFSIVMATFQAVMPFFGWIAGTTIVQYIQDYDHWVAAIILVFIGGKMIYDGALSDKNKTKPSFNPTSFVTNVTLAVATSIDALAIGFSFSAMKQNIGKLVLACAITTFLFAIGGLFIGHKFGSKRKNIAEFFGGSILIIIGVKIFLEHQGIL